MRPLVRQQHGNANRVAHRETNDPSLVAFLQSGGTLEVGEDRSVGTFARIRKGNRTMAVDAVYRDFADVLQEMEAKAKDFLNKAHDTRRQMNDLERLVQHA